jgi:hypothetical protein
MTKKESKTREELEALIMHEIRLHPECENVESVLVMQMGSAWDVQTQGSGASLICREKVGEISTRLANLYDLAQD